MTNMAHGMEVKAWKPEGDRQLAIGFPDVGDDLNAHRWVQLFPFLKLRDGRCWVTSADCSPKGFYIHEAIRRSAVQGWAKPLRVLIHTPFNCVLLCANHHETAIEPPMLEIAESMFHVYGLQYLDWLKSLPFLPGSHPLKGFLEYHGSSI